MIKYPITSYPELLTKDINVKSYFVECIDKSPSEPHRPTKEQISTGCLIGLVFYIITAVVISGGIPLSTTLPIGLALTIILWIVYSIRGQVEYNKKLKEYNNEYNQYKNNIQIHNKKIEQIQRDIELRQQNGDLSWKNQLIKKRLMTYTYKLSSGIGKKGASEDYFIKQLKNIYDCQIYQNPPIYCKDVGYKYYPDIVLLFDKDNIAIAIEIDEPYNLKDGKPIHYYSIQDGYPIFEDDEVISSSSRRPFKSRSREITNEGFILIRFAEEQVVLQPDSCCKFINDKLKLYLGFEICKKDLSTIQDIKLVDGWTFDEAKIMHKRKFRESYLKGIGQSDKKIDNSKYDDDLPF